MQRKSQGGMNAAILVAVIAGLIILYIIFLPTAEREKLVGQESTNTTNLGQNTNVLLRVFPGLLSTSNGLEGKKSIPDVFLVESVNSKELKTINPFIVRSGWFDKKTNTVDFEIDDPDNTDNVMLSLTPKKKQGILTIKLNGENVFESEIMGDSIEPIRLDKKFLKKTNSLELGVSSVGLKFWTTNEYSFENVKIIGDLTDTSKQLSANLFTLSESEYASMDKATLEFIPYCGNVNAIGTLDIFVNNKKLFSTVPVCDNAYKQSIPKSTLNEGENSIVFKTNKGSYSVEQIKIALGFKEPAVKTYYFEIDSNTFQQIRAGDKKVTLTIKFVDNNKQKMAKLDVNGHLETIDTNKNMFTEKIDSKVSDGNNYVRLEPLQDVEVVEMKLELT